MFLACYLLIDVHNIFQQQEMSGKGVLEHTLKEILVVLKPISNDWQARFQVINEIRGVVGSLESLKGGLLYCIFMVVIPDYVLF